MASSCTCGVLLGILLTIPTILSARENNSSQSNLRPDPGFGKVLFIRRPTYTPDHYYTEFINGIRFGGNISVLDLETGTIRDLLPESMTKGTVGRLDLSFDGTKVLFDFKASKKEGFRIWEVGLDGSELRQVTSPPGDEAERIERHRFHTDDMHPCYLPDGNIVFTSTRVEYEILCNASGVLKSAVLHRTTPDGKHIERLSNNSVSEFSPAVMHDGRVLYHRWEYVDKGSLCIKSLWAMHPDGTGSVEVYGNNIALPPTFIYGRPVPGHSNLFSCLGTPHYPQGPYGTVMLVDTTRDIRTTDPLTFITPVKITTEPGWDFWNGERWVRDEKGQSGHLYKDPYPLSDSLFLVSCKTDPKANWRTENGYDLYLLNNDGEQWLLYDDDKFSCFSPIPVRARPKPMVPKATRLPDLAAEGKALCVVSDIYRGMQGVERGSIKHIRINEHVPRPWSGYNPDGNYWVGARTHLGLKVQHGIVPVEEDGSACFTVPADRNIFFQALDENYMEVQRERTFVNYRPGEVRSCVGCHERTSETPGPGERKSIVLALNRAPSQPGPQPGEKNGRRTLHYPRDIQPIWDRHCIGCHDGKEVKKPDLRGTEVDQFSRSYLDLRWGDWCGTVIDEEERDGLRGAKYLPPYTLGSHQSKLVDLLRNGHPDSDGKAQVKLSLEEMVKVTTWVDSMCQFYGSYWGRHHVKDRDRPDYRPVDSVDQALSSEPPSY